MEFEQLIENSSVKNLQISYKKDYRENYKFIRDESIYGLSVCKSYLQKNIRTNEIFLCIQETFYDHQSSKIMNMLEALQLVNENPYFNQFRAFAFEELPQKSVRLYILIEYFDMNLAKIAKKRTLIEKALIDSLAKSFLKSISFLARVECSLLAISNTNVFLKSLNSSSSSNSDPYNVKILHFPFMQSCFDMVLSGQERHFNCYLSVEELECLENKVNDNSELNNATSNIFSFGALLLDLLNSSNPTAQANTSIYCKDTYRIDETNFFERINFVGQKYPKKVFLLLEQLLKFSERSTPKAILSAYDKQSDISGSQITADDTIANARQRIQNQLYTDFPIKNKIISPPTNKNNNFTDKYNQIQNTNPHSSNNQDNQHYMNSSPSFPYSDSSQKNRSQESSSYQPNQGYLNTDNNYINNSKDNNNKQFNPLGNSSQFEDTNRLNKPKSKWDIPSLQNSGGGGRQNNPLVTPFQNNPSSPSFQLSSEKKDNHIDQLIDQKVNANQYNQFLFDSVEEKDNQPNQNQRFIIQGRGDNSNYTAKQPDNKSLLTSDYFKSYISQADNESPSPLGSNLPPQNNKDNKPYNFNQTPYNQPPPPPPYQQQINPTQINNNSNNIQPPIFTNQKPPIPPPQGNSIPPPPPINNLLKTNNTSFIPPPPPPPLNFMTGNSPGNIPPAPPIGGIPPPPMINVLTQQNGKKDAQKQKNMLQGSLEVNDGYDEDDEKRRKQEVLQKLFANNNQVAPIKLPFFMPKQPAKEETEENHTNAKPLAKENNESQFKQQDQIKFQSGQIPPPPPVGLIPQMKGGQIPPPPPPPNGLIPPPPIGLIPPPPPIGLIPPPPPLLPVGLIPINATNNVIVDTNYIVKPKLEAGRIERDEQKERIEHQQIVQNQLKKQSNDILLQSQSILESSKRLLDKASKRQDNFTYSQTIIEDQDDPAAKTDTLDKYKELKQQQNEYLEQKQARHEKSQKKIEQDKENALKKIESQHSQFLSSTAKKNMQSSDHYKNSDPSNKHNNDNNTIDSSFKQNQMQSNLYASFNPDSSDYPQHTHSFNENSVAVYDNDSHQKNYKSSFGQPNNNNNNNSNAQQKQTKESGKKHNNYTSPERELESFKYDDDMRSSPERIREPSPSNYNGFGFDDGQTQNQLFTSSMSNQDNNNQNIDQSAFKFPTNVIQIINSIGGSLHQSSDPSSSMFQEGGQYYQNQPTTLYNSSLGNKNNNNLLVSSTDQYHSPYQDPNQKYNNNNSQYQVGNNKQGAQTNNFDQQRYYPDEYSNGKQQYAHNAASPESTSYEIPSQNNYNQNQLNNSTNNNTNVSSYSPSYLKNSRYSNIEFIPEKSNESEQDDEQENSLIFKSPIQQDVKDYMSQLQKNKQFYEELRKQRPQGSKQFDPQEFDSIIQESKNPPEKKSLKNSQINRSSFDSVNNNNSYKPTLDRIVENENFSQPIPHDDYENSYHNDDKTQDEQIYEDNRNLFFSEFRDFQDKDALISCFYEQLNKFPDIKKIQYKNKSYYEGQALQTDRNLIRHGFGILKQQNKDIYCGYFKNNQFDGEGVYFYNHGDIYRGQLRGNLRQGYGTYYYHEQGCIYSGEWIGNVKDGYGRLLMKNKEKYEGYFKQNVKCGRGVYYFSNGDNFEGEWVYDKKCGQGTLEFKDGSYFEGNFYDDLPFGQGKMKFTNGDEYNGNYEDGLINGYGIYIHANNQYYEGDFNKNQMNGEGIYYFKNGDKYQGQYVEGQRDGYGKYYYSNGCIFEGHWKNNQKQGEGKYIFPDNTFYQGCFESSMKQGIGKQTFKDNEFYNGCWKNDKRNGKGYYQFKDGSYYDGDWLNDQMHGEGTYYLKTGTTHQKIYGIWKDDQLYQNFQ